MKRYICQFELIGANLTVESGEGIEAFRKGFWVTNEMVYTKGLDGRFWVPPHKIQYIRKVV